MNKETFCSYPFNTIFLGADGGVKTCCSSRTDIGNINEQSIEEIIQGDKVQEIRQSIINEQWHPSCRQCKEIESSGGGSERKHILYNFDKFKDATKDTFILEKIDLRWSNICNLSCNYCYEYFSSHWANIKGIKINANKESAEDKMFSFIKNNEKTIINVNLLGGEPLLQKQNSQLFDLLPEKSFYILTNLSVDLEKNSLVKKLLNMKYVDWGVSFENVGNKFEYVRHGAKWEVLIKNLRYLKSKEPNIINIHPVYSVYNAYDLCEFYNFVESEGYFGNLYWQLLLNVQGLDIFRQNINVRKKALIELDKCISLYENKFNMDMLKEIRSSIEQSLTKNISSKAAFLKFIDNIELKYLTNKNHKFTDLWPEIYKDITEYP